MIRAWIRARVASKRLAAADIYAYELVDPEGRDLPSFSAGSHIDVEIAPDLVRQYSLCNNPLQQDRYEIAVLRDANSRGGSIAMHALEVGALVNISEPRNHFALVPGAERSVLLAGGIGMTPLLCMAERLAHLQAPFEMHYCTRSLDRTAYHDRISGSALVGNVAFHFDQGPDEQKFDPETVFSRAPAGTHVYVCGPSGFIDWVYGVARAHAWPESQLHREYFTPPEPVAAPGGEIEFHVRIASTGATYRIPVDKTVTDVLGEHGIEIPMSCSQGICGTCMTHVLEGEPDHRDAFLTDGENDQFTPCCSRSFSKLLVLDL